MKKVLLGILLVIVVLVAAILLIVPKGPDLKKYAYLEEPAISQKADQNMLVVETTGNPDQTAPAAIKLLYTTYFALKGVSKNPADLAPRARWAADPKAPPNTWKGAFALPVPDTLKILPKVKPEASLTVALHKWEYGTVAEVLYTGPYDKEQPTIDKLKYFITQNGYTIVGEQEEEYLKGPSMFGKGNPEKYQTIIRYRVEALPAKE